MSRHHSSFVRLGTIAIALALSVPVPARAEKCDPRDPSICVGGPTGDPVCGAEGQGCCAGGECDAGLVCSDHSCAQPPPVVYHPYRYWCNDNHTSCLHKTSYQDALNAATLACSSHGGVRELYETGPFSGC